MNKKSILLSCLSVLALTASAQKITTDNETIDCGKIVYNQPATVNFELKNKGGSKLVIKDVRTSCGCTTVDYPRTPVEGGASFTVSATYDARQLGHFFKQVAIYSNASSEPTYLTMTGVVVEKVIDFSGEYPYKLGDVLVDKNEIEFDDVNSGDMPMQKIHIMNNSTKTVTPVIMHLPAYLKANISPTRIAPGHSGEATITLLSKKLRNFGLSQTSVYLGMFPGDKVGQGKEIGVSAILLPGFSDLTDFQRLNAPKLQLSEESIDIDLEGKKKKTTTLILQNVGKDMLDIQEVQMFTVGLQLQLNKRHLAPGEEAKLKVTIKDEIKSARTKPRILMITNDPNRAMVVININVK
ncbi:MAG: DUF1573 domain-containing protein [Prevotella sp.]|nr:DUF1573 domain-containing protein [Prevotella sp.]